VEFILIFVFDLDGTICFKGKPVSELILAKLEQLKEQGHEIIFASARPVRDMLPVLHPRFHQDTLIGGNGALIFKKGEALHAESFHPELRHCLQQLLSEHQATYLIDSEWDYTYTGPLNHPILNNLDPHKLAQHRQLHQLKNIVKILILSANDTEALKQKLAEYDIVIHTYTDEHLIDISPSGINKWYALKKLGIVEQSYIAFGNDTNDIIMFQHAKQTIMVGHHDQLAPHASASIPASDEKIVQQIDLFLNQGVTYITYTAQHQQIATSGTDEIDSFLKSQNNAEKRSLLFCLDKLLDPYYGYHLPNHDDITLILEKHLFERHSREVKEDILQLLTDYARKPLTYLAEHIEEIETALREDALYAIQLNLNEIDI
jgi:Cof subfamily protein (haloacid dehalogenase superfamily)